MRDMENASGTFGAIGSAAAQMGSDAAGAAGSVSKLAGALGPLAGGAAIGGAIVAGATAVTLAIGAIGGSIAELSGLVGTLPGIFAGGAAAFGTLTLATQGFSDAMGDIRDSKKFAEDLKELSPNAAQAATAIQQLMPSLDGLRAATQDSLFAGVGQELTQLANTYLPSIQQMTTSIASSFNAMFKAVGNQLMTPETQAAIQSAMGNIGQAFQNLVPAIGPVTKAIADLANVSTGFLPGFATAIANAATQFSNFLTNASQTGELRQWIQDGVDAFKQFVTLAPDLKQMFVDFKANGGAAINDVVGLLRVAIRIVDELGGAYSRVSGSVKAMANVVAASFGMIEKAISMSLEPLRAMINLNNKLNPVFKIEQIPRFGDITVPFGDAGMNPFAPKVQGNAVAVPGAGGPSVPGMSLATGAVAPRVAPVFMPDAAKAAGGSAASKLPTVPYGNQDPMSLLQGFPVTASLYGAAGAVLDQQQKVAQARSDLAALEKSGTATQSEVVAKKNELARAEREQHEAELRLIEAKQSATNKSLKSMQSTHDAMSTLGAGLDQDLGASKGLAGLADNLVRFVGNLATAPLQASLQRQIDADPRKGGFGLLGILGAQGAFGEQYTGMTQQQGYSAAGWSGMPGMRGGLPYGLATGTNTGGYGSSGAVFPQWVHALEQVFGVKASTYSGHQESDRNEPGYAPNPMHLNRGIDWTGSPAAMQAFANFMAGQPNAEQVIYQNPVTGQNTEAVAGQARPGYFAGDLSEHRGHVHTRQAFGIDAPGFSQGAQDATGALSGLAGAANSATQALTGPAGGWNADWNSMAQKEASGNWAANTGNGFYGGLQFTQPSWDAAGGGQYAPRADLAAPYQQALTAEQLLRMQGPGAWPNTFTPGSAGPGGGGMYPGMGMTQGLPFAPLGPVSPGGPAVGLGSAAGIGPAQPGLGSAAGFGVQNPTQIGAVVPEASGMGKGGIGMSGGGLMEAAMQAGGLALDAMAPGAGQAAQTGMKLINRTIQYGGQAAGIGVQGLMDTFLPMGGSQLAQSNWATRIIGGLAGALPAIPNMAGKKAPEQAQGAQGQGAQTPTTNVTHNTTINAEGRDNGGLARDWEYNTTQAAMTPAVGP
ncbi:hypothetical protein A7G45_26990 [Mycolicibacterium llatzerense]|nr:hypothetical protein [Mycolicibacterium llatzerense]